MLKLETRPQASKLWTYGSPLLALAVTVLIGVALFAALGKDPVRGLQVFFWEPVKSQYAIGELMVKATPLLLIALGLAVCFRSNVWNIGAEGQFVIGAVVAGGVALMADKTTGPWIVPAIFWLLIIGLIITLVATRRRRWARAGWGGPWGPHGVGPWASAQAAHNAETVLAERFARGDIDEVEYRARLEVLRSQAPQPPQG